MKGKLRKRDGEVWAEFAGVPGFENYAITFRPRIVHGKPRATSLHFDEIDPDDLIGLTAQRLASLPLQHLVNLAIKMGDFTLQPDLQADLRRIKAADDTGYTDPRSVASPKQVATVWLTAFHRGDPAPRQAVCDALNIAERTAEKKIGQAVELGLIPAEYRRKNRTPKRSGKKGNTTERTSK